MSVVRRHRVVMRLVLGMVLVATRAVAETAPAEESSIAPAPDDTDDARRAFRDGSALAKQGRWVDALGAFRQSALLRPHPVTTYNVAYCERALGHYVRASIEFRAALEPPASPGAPALSDELSTQARTFLADAERETAHLDVTLASTDVAMSVDGSPIVPSAGAPSTWIVAETTTPGVAPRPPSQFSLWLDPGPHAFVVTGEDGKERVSNRTVRAGESLALRLDVARPEPTAPLPAPIDKAAIEPRAPGGSRVPAYVAFGVAGASLVASGVFAALSLHEMSALDSDPRCPRGQCPDEPHYRDAEARITRDADFATVGLAVGVGAAALGTYFFFSSSAHDAKRAAVIPTITPRGAGVVGRF